MEIKSHLKFTAAMKSPLLSVVIPVYNRADIIGRTLDSVFSQQGCFHLIIVDNASTDGTRDVVNRYIADNSNPDIHATLLEERAIYNACGARNRGLDAVVTPYTMFFDSDDMMLPGHIARVIEAFSQDNTLDIAGWDVENIPLYDEKAKILPFRDKKLLFEATFNAIFATHRYAARTDLFRKAGGWNNTLAGWNDYELGFRLLALNPRVKRLGDAVTVRIFAGENSITGTDFSSNTEKWEKAVDAIEITFRKNGYPVEWLEMRRAFLAGLYRRENSPHASRLLNEVLSRTGSLRRRFMYRLVYTYTAAGGRGLQHILRPFLS